MSKIEKLSVGKSINELFSYLNSNVTQLNNSKLFAGLMIIILNIASKFVTFKLSKTMEGYLKYTFSKQILVFAMSWMGTRDVYTALIITMFYVVMTEYILNENSAFCCLPEEFTDYHVSLMDNDTLTDEDIKKAREVLDKLIEKNKNCSSKDSKDSKDSK